MTAKKRRKRILSFALVLVVILLLLTLLFEPMYTGSKRRGELKYGPKKTAMATVTSETSSRKGRQGCHIYSFNVNDKEYSGECIIQSSIIGYTLLVDYVPEDPNWNCPHNYYK